MKAKIVKPVHNARQPDKKELIDTYNVIAKMRGYDGKVELRNIVTARLYMGRSSSASVVYCCLWVHGATDATQCSGRGSAGGYGYHKGSAALDEAITSAGIELYGSAYSGGLRWDYKEERERTPKEIAAIKRAQNKQRCNINGVGDSAMEKALIAIAKAAGARGQCLVVHN